MAEYYELQPVFDVGVAPFFNFPRALYPPDHPDGPVPDGPDVEAYKLVAWYLGRWRTTDGKPDPSPKMDRAYSKAFAHGDGTGVGSSGIEGLQRQAEIAGASGVLGHRTFDAMIYQRIPQGLPNAGKFPLSINKYAAQLLEDAYQRFREEPEDTAPVSGSKREKCMAHMAAREGYTESPAGSNIDSRPDGIHKCQDVTAGGHWLDGTAWCGSWCMYCLNAAAGIKPNSNLASVASIEGMAKNGQYPFRGWTTDRSKVAKADLVVIGGYGVHVEMVRGPANPDGSVPSWGGNTSPGTSGSQSNGGGAFRRVRYSSEIRGFALVDFDEEPELVPDWRTEQSSDVLLAIALLRLLSERAAKLE